MQSEYDYLAILDEDVHNDLRENLLSSEGDDSDYKKYLRLVHDTYTKTLEACNQNDDAKFAGFCHNLKSNVGTLGYLRLSAICEEIDIYYKQSTKVLPSQKQMFLSFCREYEECQRNLKL